MRYSNLKEEQKLWKKGYNCIACIDEAGRGPLAGPVVASAVCILDLAKDSLTRLSLLKMQDSKQLSWKQREKFYVMLMTQACMEWGIGIVSEKVIDRINIFQATKLAMKKAVKDLQAKLKKKHRNIDILVIDGTKGIESSLPQLCIVKADEKVFSCSAASVIAKVTRDRIMLRYHKKYPQYGFDKHKGYGTKLHVRRLRSHGPCPIHRMSFRPCLVGRHACKSF
ncbi:MAG: ribonuclease HII [Candidatus Wildermuthbacteria bacterium]|nr:ribonuclease HII [Candidatus Wildermuthbacteria bacterium]